MPIPLGPRVPIQLGARADTQVPATRSALPPAAQAIANIVAQCGGACIGSLLLWGTSDLRREHRCCATLLWCGVVCCAVPSALLHASCLSA